MNRLIRIRRVSISSVSIGMQLTPVLEWHRRSFSNRSPRSTQTTNLSRGHRVIFSPGACSGRRSYGQWSLFIMQFTWHTSISSPDSLHARHAHTRARAYVPRLCMYDKRTHTLVFSRYLPSAVIYDYNGVEIRIRVSLRDIASGSEGRAG